MVKLLLLAAVFVQTGDYEAARQRMQSLLNVLERAAAAESIAADNPQCQCDPCTCEVCTCTGDDCKCESCECAVSTEPVAVKWSRENLPARSAPEARAYMITADWCQPCQRSKARCGDLIGDASSGFPVETIDVDDRPNYAAEMGITHARTIPTWVIVNSAGKEVARQSGEQTRSRLTGFLRRNQISLDPVVDAPEPTGVVATVSSLPTVAIITAAFTEHLVRQEGGEFPVGGIFDRELSVPEQVPQILAILMAGDPLDIEEAGLQVKWIGDNRRLEFISTEELKLNPPVTVRLQKWGASVTTTLSGFRVRDQGREVRLILKGPDFTIRFVP